MAKSTSLLYGGTGTGKTDLLRTFAKGLWETKQKKTRVVSAEKAQSEGILREGIENGWIIPWWLNDLRDKDGVITPFERITDAVLGKWPLDPSNPHSALVPAWSIDSWRAMCTNKEKHQDGKEKLVYQQPRESKVASELVCPLCKNPVIQYPVRSITDKRLEEVGAYAFEGATEFGDMMMQNMAVKTASLQSSGTNMSGAGVGGNVAISFKDGQYIVGGNSQSHYGTAQNQIKMKIGESAHLPVDYVWWTAVMDDGKDSDKGGVLIFGPKIPGNAKTADVPRWFGTTLSTCTVPVTTGQEQKDEYRLYLSSYYQTWIQMIAKQKVIVDNRIPSTNLKGIPQFIKVDAEQELIEVAGRKMRRDLLLWEVMALIQERQVVGKPAQVAQAVGNTVTK